MRKLVTRGCVGFSSLAFAIVAVGACSGGGFEEPEGSAGTTSAGSQGFAGSVVVAGSTGFAGGPASGGSLGGAGAPGSAGSFTAGSANGGSANGGSANGGSSTGGNSAGAPAGSGAAGMTTGGAPAGGRGGTGGVPSAGNAGTTNGGSAGKGGSTGMAGAPGGQCSATQISCNGMCRDRLTDASNCGSCGNVCSGGRSCNNGACACPSGRTFCSNQCVDASTDEANCGACGRACSSGQTCTSGTCSGGSTGGMTCSSVGSSMTVNSTITVRAGQTYDGQCRRFIAGSSLGDGSQAENQDPVFEIENGGTLINVVIGAPAADGIHTSGNATLRNITWEDVGEDALTIKGSGTVTLDGGSARNGSDKIFQINAASTFRLSNFRAQNAGKLIRQNGGTTFKTSVFIDRCDISGMDECIFRTDSSSSTVSMTNTRYSDIGDSLFIGVSSGNITTSGNTQY